MSGRYTVSHIDDVKCALREDRSAIGKQQAAPAMVLQGLDKDGRQVFAPPAQNIGVKKWERCLELFWYAVMFVGNSCHHVQDKDGHEIAWFSYTTFLIIWGVFRQYVIDAPPDLRVPYLTARQNEMEFRRELFGYIQKEKVSLDEAFEKHGYNQLRRLFQYQANPGTVIKDAPPAVTAPPVHPPPNEKPPKKSAAEKRRARREKGQGKSNPGPPRKSNYQRPGYQRWHDDRPLERPRGKGRPY